MNTLDPPTRLRVGMIVEIDGTKHRIEKVNFSRAYCVPLQKKKVEIQTVMGQKISFSKNGEGVSISPNSECEILGYVGEDEPVRVRTRNKRVGYAAKEVRAPRPRRARAKRRASPTLNKEVGAGYTKFSGLLPNIEALRLTVSREVRRYFSCQMTLLSSNDDNGHQMNHSFFALGSRAPRPARLPPLGLPLNSPSPANIGKRRLPVSV